MTYMPESKQEELLREEKAKAVSEFSGEGAVRVGTGLLILDSLVSSLGFQEELRDSVVDAIRLALADPEFSRKI